MGTSQESNLSWLHRRELGSASRLGNNDSFSRMLYSSVDVQGFWDPATTSSDGSHGGIFNFDFATDGSVLVAACERSSFLVFDPRNCKLFRSKSRAHSDCVNCVRFLDTRSFVTCSDDTNVVLWDLRYLKSSVRTFQGHSNWVKNIEYASSLGLLVTSGFDGAVYTWNINNNDNAHSLRRSLPAGRVYHFNVIYNHARCPLSVTADTEASLAWTRHAVERLQLSGLVNTYYHDRDSVKSQGLVHELTRVLAGSEVTVVLLSPGFVRDCWPRYWFFSCFKALFTRTSFSPSSSSSSSSSSSFNSNTDRLSPRGVVVVALGLGVEDLPAGLRKEDVLFFSKDWQGDAQVWGRLEASVTSGVTVPTGVAAGNDGHRPLSASSPSSLHENGSGERKRGVATDPVSTGATTPRSTAESSGSAPFKSPRIADSASNGRTSPSNVNDGRDASPNASPRSSDVTFNRPASPRTSDSESDVTMASLSYTDSGFNTSGTSSPRSCSYSASNDVSSSTASSPRTNDVIYRGVKDDTSDREDTRGGGKRDHPRYNGGGGRHPQPQLGVSKFDLDVGALEPQTQSPRERSPLREERPSSLSLKLATPTTDEHVLHPPAASTHAATEHPPDSRCATSSVKVDEEQLPSVKTSVMRIEESPITTMMPAPDGSSRRGTNKEKSPTSSDAKRGQEDAASKTPAQNDRSKAEDKKGRWEEERHGFWAPLSARSAQEERHGAVSSSSAAQERHGTVSSSRRSQEGAVSSSRSPVAASCDEGVESAVLDRLGQTGIRRESQQPTSTMTRVFVQGNTVTVDTVHSPRSSAPVGGNLSTSTCHNTSSQCPVQDKPKASSGLGRQTSENGSLTLKTNARAQHSETVADRDSAATVSRHNGFPGREATAIKTTDPDRSGHPPSGDSLTVQSAAQAQNRPSSLVSSTPTSSTAIPMTLISNSTTSSTSNVNSLISSTTLSNTANSSATLSSRANSSTDNSNTTRSTTAHSNTANWSTANSVTTISSTANVNSTHSTKANSSTADLSTANSSTANSSTANSNKSTPDLATAAINNGPQQLPDSVRLAEIDAKYTHLQSDHTPADAVDHHHHHHHITSIEDDPDFSLNDSLSSSLTTSDYGTMSPRSDLSGGSFRDSGFNGSGLSSSSPFSSSGLDVSPRTNTTPRSLSPEESSAHHESRTAVVDQSSGASPPKRPLGSLHLPEIHEQVVYAGGDGTESGSVSNVYLKNNVKQDQRTRQGVSTEKASTERASPKNVSLERASNTVYAEVHSSRTVSAERVSSNTVSIEKHAPNSPKTEVTSPISSYPLSASSSGGQRQSTGLDTQSAGYRGAVHSGNLHGPSARDSRSMSKADITVNMTRKDSWIYHDIDGQGWALNDVLLPLYRVMCYALSRSEMPYF